MYAVSHPDYMSEYLQAQRVGTKRRIKPTDKDIEEYLERMATPDKYADAIAVFIAGRLRAVL